MKFVGGGCALLAILSLSACGQEADDIRLQQMSCPMVAVPDYSRDLVQWQGEGHDLTNLAYHVRIADAAGKCTRKPDNDNLYATFTVSLDATRGPALSGRDIAVSYFVAVMRGSDIIDKQIYPVAATFAPNTDTLSITGKPISMTLPLSTSVSGSDYTIEIGMQLTQAQIDDNQSAARR